jgi:hypothetical protein
MFLKVSADGALTLEDRSNFRAFKLVVDGSKENLERVTSTLTGAVEFADADTAWVFEAALRRFPEVVQDAAWQDALGAMIEKARPHGWIDDRRKAIKAHVEWTG